MRGQAKPLDLPYSINLELPEEIVRHENNDETPLNRSRESDIPEVDVEDI